MRSPDEGRVRRPTVPLWRKSGRRRRVPHPPQCSARYADRLGGFKAGTTVRVPPGDLVVGAKAPHSRARRSSSLALVLPRSRKQAHIAEYVCTTPGEDGGCAVRYGASVSPSPHGRRAWQRSPSGAADPSTHARSWSASEHLYVLGKGVAVESTMQRRSLHADPEGNP